MSPDQIDVIYDDLSKLIIDQLPNVDTQISIFFATNEVVWIKSAASTKLITDDMIEDLQLNF